jgi:hypothetical protein
MAKHVDITVKGMKFRVTPKMVIAMAKDLPIAVVIEREPENPYDENAIRVVAVEPPWVKAHGPMQIGYIAKEVAAVYAPLMDFEEFPFHLAGEIILIDEAEGEATLRLQRRFAKKLAVNEGI